MRQRKPKWVTLIEDYGITYADYCEFQKLLGENKISIRHYHEETWIGGFFRNLPPGQCCYITFRWGLGVLFDKMQDPAATVAECQAIANEAVMA